MMVKFQVCTTREKTFILKLLLLKPCGALWHPVKTSLSKINLVRMSVSKKLSKTPLHSLKWIIFEGYGVGCSRMGNNFLLFMLKNPRSRSRCMCCSIREQGVGSGGVDPPLLKKNYDPLRLKFTTSFSKFDTFYYIVTSLLLNKEFYDPPLKWKRPLSVKISLLTYVLLWNKNVEILWQPICP